MGKEPASVCEFPHCCLLAVSHFTHQTCGFAFFFTMSSTLCASGRTRTHKGRRGSDSIDTAKMVQTELEMFLPSFLLCALFIMCVCSGLGYVACTIVAFLSNCFFFSSKSIVHFSSTCATQLNYKCVFSKLK